MFLALKSHEIKDRINKLEHFEVKRRCKLAKVNNLKNEIRKEENKYGITRENT